MKTKRKRSVPSEKPVYEGEGAERSSWKRLWTFLRCHPRLLVLIVLSLAGFLLYFNSIQNEFVFDDISLILENKLIRTPDYLPDLIGLRGRLPYRPLRGISYWIDYQFTGLNPVGYHLSNILYHVLASYLVFLIASLLSGDRRLAWMTALLFSVHPIQTEAVTYISGRRDILTALFFFMGFYFFLKERGSPSKRYLFLIYLSYILSLLSKEMGVTLPAVFLLYDLLKSPGPAPGSEPAPGRFRRLVSRAEGVVRKHWAFYLTLFLIAAFFTFYKVFVKNPSRQEGFYGGTMASNFLTVLDIWVFYIRMLILPLPLNAAHSFPLAASVFEWRTLLSISLLLAVFVVLIMLIRKREIYAFAGLWFFVTLLPVSHIFPHHELLAEHYLYLPSFGFSMILGCLFTGLLQRGRGRPWLYLPLAVLLLFYAYQVIHRNPDWRNELTLWADAARKSPDNLRAKTNLAAAYNRSGLYDRAIKESSDLLKREPRNHEIYLKIGISYMFQKDYDRAMDQFRRSIEMKAENPMAYNNLGVIYLEKKQLDEAIGQFKQAISYRPRYGEAHNNLAKAFALKGAIDEALEEERKAIASDALTPEYRFNLAKLYENKRLLKEAVAEYREALRLDPKFFEACFSLGIAYTRLDQSREAISEFERAIRLDPGSGKAHFMLAINLIKSGNREEAKRNLEKALRLVPGEQEREKIQSLLNRLGAAPK